MTTAPRRLAIVCPYALSVPGGVQEQALGMSREWARRGTEVRLYAPDSADDVVYDTPATVVRCGRLLSLPANGSRAPLTLSPLASRRVADDIAAFAPDVVLLHEPLAPVLGWATLRRQLAPTYGIFHRAGGGPAYSLTRPLLRRLVRRLRGAVAVSDEARRTIWEGAGLDARVLFNGFETDRFRSEPRVPSPTPRILFVGRLEERKGVETVVAAVQSHNAHAEAPWHLDVVGDGPLRSSLQARTSGDATFTWHGRVSDDRKRHLLRTASVAVAASTHGESFGLVVLEPMAAETPVVVSSIPGYVAAGGPIPTYFTPGDSSELIAAIERALTTSKDTLAAGRARAEQWSMRSLVDAYNDLFQSAW